MNQPQLVFGFHGCEEDVRDKILNSDNEHLDKSSNSYDWLGNGIYFWLNDPMRAYEWAEQKKKTKPAVIGAVIDLGECLNFCERTSIELVSLAYRIVKYEAEMAGIEMKKNKVPDKGGFNLIRELDCAVIERLHQELEKDGERVFDTVYGFFQEGEDAYPGSGIKGKSHIQICVRNPSCIKGYFLPRRN